MHAPPPAIYTVYAVPSVFAPRTIVLHAGQSAIVRFPKTAGVHGLYAPGLGVDHTVIEDAHTTEITIAPQRPGIYKLRCRIYCGPQHPTMVLTLIVEP